MQDGKALHHHQSGTGNTSQTKRTSFYLKKTNKQTIKASIHAYFLPFLGLTNFKIIHNIRNFRIWAHYWLCLV